MMMKGKGNFLRTEVGSFFHDQSISKREPDRAGFGPMAAVARIGPRLANLSHSELVELATQQAQADAEALRVAEDFVARRRAFAPSWLRSAVLLSSDLVTHIMRWLHLTDAAAGCACTLWAGCWRRHVRRISFIHGPAITHCIPLGQRPACQPLGILVLADRRVIVAVDTAEDEDELESTAAIDADRFRSMLILFSTDWEVVARWSGRDSQHRESGFDRAYALARSPIESDLIYVVDCSVVRSVRLTGNRFRNVRISERMANPCNLARPVRDGKLLVGGQSTEVEGRDICSVVDAGTMGVDASFMLDEAVEVLDLCLLDDRSLLVSGTVVHATRRGASHVSLFGSPFQTRSRGVLLRRFATDVEIECLHHVGGLLLGTARGGRSARSSVVRLLRLADGAVVQTARPIGCTYI